MTSWNLLPWQLNTSCRANTANRDLTTDCSSEEISAPYQLDINYNPRKETVQLHFLPRDEETEKLTDNKSVDENKQSNSIKANNLCTQEMFIHNTNEPTHKSTQVPSTSFKNDEKEKKRSSKKESSTSAEKHPTVTDNFTDSNKIYESKNLIRRKNLLSETDTGKTPKPDRKKKHKDGRKRSQATDNVTRENSNEPIRVSKSIEKRHKHRRQHSEEIVTVTDNFAKQSFKNQLEISKDAHKKEKHRKKLSAETITITGNFSRENCEEQIKDQTAKEIYEKEDNKKQTTDCSTKHNTESKKGRNKLVTGSNNKLQLQNMIANFHPTLDKNTKIYFQQSEPKNPHEISPELQIKSKNSVIKHISNKGKGKRKPHPSLETKFKGIQNATSGRAAKCTSEESCNSNNATVPTKDKKEGIRFFFIRNRSGKNTKTKADHKKEKRTNITKENKNGSEEINCKRSTKIKGRSSNSHINVVEVEKSNKEKVCKHFKSKKTMDSKHDEVGTNFPSTNRSKSVDTKTFKKHVERDSVESAHGVGDADVKLKKKFKKKHNVSISSEAIGHGSRGKIDNGLENTNPKSKRRSKSETNIKNNEDATSVVPKKTEEDLVKDQKRKTSKKPSDKNEQKGYEKNNIIETKVPGDEMHKKLKKEKNNVDDANPATKKKHKNKHNHKKAVDESESLHKKKSGASTDNEEHIKIELKNNIKIQDEEKHLNALNLNEKQDIIPQESIGGSGDENTQKTSKKRRSRKDSETIKDIDKKYLRHKVIESIETTDHKKREKSKQSRKDHHKDVTFTEVVAKASEKISKDDITDSSIESKEIRKKTRKQKEKTNEKYLKESCGKRTSKYVDTESEATVRTEHEKGTLARNASTGNNSVVVYHLAKGNNNISETTSVIEDKHFIQRLKETRKSNSDDQNIIKITKTQLEALISQINKKPHLKQSKTLHYGLPNTEERAGQPKKVRKEVSFSQLNLKPVAGHYPAPATTLNLCNPRPFDYVGCYNAQVFPSPVLVLPKERKQTKPKKKGKILDQKSVVSEAITKKEKFQYVSGKRYSNNRTVRNFAYAENVIERARKALRENGSSTLSFTVEGVEPPKMLKSSIIPSYLAKQNTCGFQKKLHVTVLPVVEVTPNFQRFCGRAAFGAADYRVDTSQIEISYPHPLLNTAKDKKLSESTGLGTQAEKQLVDKKPSQKIPTLQAFTDLSNASRKESRRSSASPSESNRKAETHVTGKNLKEDTILFGRTVNNMSEQNFSLNRQLSISKSESVLSRVMNKQPEGLSKPTEKSKHTISNEEELDTGRFATPTGTGSTQSKKYIQENRKSSEKLNLSKEKLVALGHEVLIKMEEYMESHRKYSEEENRSKEQELLKNAKEPPEEHHREQLEQQERFTSGQNVRSRIQKYMQELKEKRRHSRERTSSSRETSPDRERGGDKEISNRVSPVHNENKKPTTAAGESLNKSRTERLRSPRRRTKASARDGLLSPSKRKNSVSGKEDLTERNNTETQKLTSATDTINRKAAVTSRENLSEFTASSTSGRYANASEYNRLPSSLKGENSACSKEGSLERKKGTETQNFIAANRATTVKSREHSNESSKPGSSSPRKYIKTSENNRLTSPSKRKGPDSCKDASADRKSTKTQNSVAEMDTEDRKAASVPRENLNGSVVSSSDSPRRNINTSECDHLPFPFKRKSSVSGKKTSAHRKNEEIQNSVTVPNAESKKTKTHGELLSEFIPPILERPGRYRNGTSDHDRLPSASKRKSSGKEVSTNRKSAESKSVDSANNEDNEELATVSPHTSSESITSSFTSPRRYSRRLSHESSAFPTKEKLFNGDLRENICGKVKERGGSASSGISPTKKDERYPSRMPPQNVVAEVELITEDFEKVTNFQQNLAEEEKPLSTKMPPGRTSLQMSPAFSCYSVSGESETEPKDVITKVLNVEKTFSSGETMALTKITEETSSQNSMDNSYSHHSFRVYTKEEKYPSNYFTFNNCIKLDKGADLSVPPVAHYNPNKSEKDFTKTSLKQKLANVSDDENFEMISEQTAEKILGILNLNGEHNTERQHLSSSKIPVLSYASSQKIKAEQILEINKYTKLKPETQQQILRKNDFDQESYCKDEELQNKVTENVPHGEQFMVMSCSSSNVKQAKNPVKQKTVKDKSNVSDKKQAGPEIECSSCSLLNAVSQVVENDSDNESKVTVVCFDTELQKNEEKEETREYIESISFTSGATGSFENDFNNDFDEKLKETRNKTETEYLPEENFVEKRKGIGCLPFGKSKKPIKKEEESRDANKPKLVDNKTQVTHKFIPVKGELNECKNKTCLQKSMTENSKKEKGADTDTETTKIANTKHQKEGKIEPTNQKESKIDSGSKKGDKKEEKKDTDSKNKARRDLDEKEIQQVANLVKTNVIRELQAASLLKRNKLGQRANQNEKEIKQLDEIIENSISNALKQRVYSAMHSSQIENSGFKTPKLSENASMRTQGVFVQVKNEKVAKQDDVPCPERSRTVLGNYREQQTFYKTPKMVLQSKQIQQDHKTDTPRSTKGSDNRFGNKNATYLHNKVLRTSDKRNLDCEVKDCQLACCVKYHQSGFNVQQRREERKEAILEKLVSMISDEPDFLFLESRLDKLLGIQHEPLLENSNAKETRKRSISNNSENTEITTNGNDQRVMHVQPLQNPFNYRKTTQVAYSLATKKCKTRKQFLKPNSCNETSAKKKNAGCATNTNWRNESGEWCKECEPIKPKALKPLAGLPVATSKREPKNRRGTFSQSKSKIPTAKKSTIVAVRKYHSKSGVGDTSETGSYKIRARNTTAGSSYSTLKETNKNNVPIHSKTNLKEPKSARFLTKLLDIELLENSENQTNVTSCSSKRLHPASKLKTSSCLYTKNYRSGRHLSAYEKRKRYGESLRNKKLNAKNKLLKVPEAEQSVNQDCIYCCPQDVRVVTPQRTLSANSERKVSPPPNFSYKCSQPPTSTKPGKEMAPPRSPPPKFFRNSNEPTTCKKPEIKALSQSERYGYEPYGMMEGHQASGLDYKKLDCYLCTKLCCSTTNNMVAAETDDSDNLNTSLASTKINKLNKYHTVPTITRPVRSIENRKQNQHNSAPDERAHKQVKEDHIYQAYPVVANHPNVTDVFRNKFKTESSISLFSRESMFSCDNFWPYVLPKSTASICSANTFHSRTVYNTKSSSLINTNCCDEMCNSLEETRRYKRMARGPRLRKRNALGRGSCHSGNFCSPSKEVFYTIEQNAKNSFSEDQKISNFSPLSLTPSYEFCHSTPEYVHNRMENTQFVEERTCHNKPTRIPRRKISLLEACQYLKNSSLNDHRCKPTNEQTKMYLHENGKGSTLVPTLSKNNTFYENKREHAANQHDKYKDIDRKTFFKDTKSLIYQSLERDSKNLRPPDRKSKSMHHSNLPSQQQGMNNLTSGCNDQNTVIKNFVGMNQNINKSANNNKKSTFDKTCAKQHAIAKVQNNVRIKTTNDGGEQGRLTKSHSPKEINQNTDKGVGQRKLKSSALNRRSYDDYIKVTDKQRCSMKNLSLMSPRERFFSETNRRYLDDNSTFSVTKKEEDSYTIFKFDEDFQIQKKRKRSSERDRSHERFKIYAYNNIIELDMEYPPVYSKYTDTENINEPFEFTGMEGSKLLATAHRYEKECLRNCSCKNHKKMENCFNVPVTPTSEVTESGYGSCKSKKSGSLRKFFPQEGGVLDNLTSGFNCFDQEVYVDECAMFSSLSAVSTFPVNTSNCYTKDCSGRLSSSCATDCESRPGSSQQKKQTSLKRSTPNSDYADSPNDLLPRPPKIRFNINEATPPYWYYMGGMRSKHYCTNQEKLEDINKRNKKPCFQTDRISQKSEVTEEQPSSPNRRRKPPQQNPCKEPERQSRNNAQFNDEEKFGSSIEKRKPGTSQEQKLRERQDYKQKRPGDRTSNTVNFDSDEEPPIFPSCQHNLLAPLKQKLCKSQGHKEDQSTDKSETDEEHFLSPKWNRRYLKLGKQNLRKNQERKEPDDQNISQYTLSEKEHSDVWQSDSKESVKRSKRKFKGLFRTVSKESDVWQTDSKGSVKRSEGRFKELIRTISRPFHLTRKLDGDRFVDGEQSTLHRIGVKKKFDPESKQSRHSWFTNYSNRNANNDPETAPPKRKLRDIAVGMSRTHCDCKLDLECLQKQVDQCHEYANKVCIESRLRKEGRCKQFSYYKEIPLCVLLGRKVSESPENVKSVSKRSSGTKRSEKLPPGLKILDDDEHAHKVLKLESFEGSKHNKDFKCKFVKKFRKVSFDEKPVKKQSAKENQTLAKNSSKIKEKSCNLFVEQARKFFDGPGGCTKSTCTNLRNSRKESKEQSEPPFVEDTESAFRDAKKELLGTVFDNLLDSNKAPKTNEKCRNLFVGQAKTLLGEPRRCTRETCENMEKLREDSKEPSEQPFVEDAKNAFINLKGLSKESIVPLKELLDMVFERLLNLSVECEPSTEVSTELVRVPSNTSSNRSSQHSIKERLELPCSESTSVVCQNLSKRSLAPLEELLDTVFKNLLLNTSDHCLNGSSKEQSTNLAKFLTKISLKKLSQASFEESPEMFQSCTTATCKNLINLSKESLVPLRELLDMVFEKLLVNTSKKSVSVSSKTRSCELAKTPSVTYTQTVSKNMKSLSYTSMEILLEEPSQKPSELSRSSSKQTLQKSVTESTDAVSKNQTNLPRNFLQTQSKKVSAQSLVLPAKQSAKELPRKTIKETSDLSSEEISSKVFESPTETSSEESIKKTFQGCTPATCKNRKRLSKESKEILEGIFERLLILSKESMHSSPMEVDISPTEAFLKEPAEHLVKEPVPECAKTTFKGLQKLSNESPRVSSVKQPIQVKPNQASPREISSKESLHLVKESSQLPFFGCTEATCKNLKSSSENPSSMLKQEAPKETSKSPSESLSEKSKDEEHNKLLNLLKDAEVELSKNDVAADVSIEDSSEHFVKTLPEGQILRCTKTTCKNIENCSEGPAGMMPKEAFTQIPDLTSENLPNKSNQKYSKLLNQFGDVEVDVSKNDVASSTEDEALPEPSGRPTKEASMENLKSPSDSLSRDSQEELYYKLLHLFRDTETGLSKEVVTSLTGFSVQYSPQESFETLPEAPVLGCSNSTCKNLRNFAKEPSAVSLKEASIQTFKSSSHNLSEKSKNRLKETEAVSLDEVVRPPTEDSLGTETPCTRTISMKPGNLDKGSASVSLDEISIETAKPSSQIPLEGKSFPECSNTTCKNLGSLSKESRELLKKTIQKLMNTSEDVLGGSSKEVLMKFVKTLQNTPSETRKENNENSFSTKLALAKQTYTHNKSLLEFSESSCRNLSNLSKESRGVVSASLKKPSETPTEKNKESLSERPAPTKEMSEYGKLQSEKSFTEKSNESSELSLLGCTDSTCENLSNLSEESRELLIMAFQNLMSMSKGSSSVISQDVSTQALESPLEKTVIEPSHNTAKEQSELHVPETKITCKNPKCWSKESRELLENAFEILASVLSKQPQQPVKSPLETSKSTAERPSKSLSKCACTYHTSPSGSTCDSLTKLSKESRQLIEKTFQNIVNTSKKSVGVQSKDEPQLVESSLSETTSNAVKEQLKASYSGCICKNPSPLSEYTSESLASFPKRSRELIVAFQNILNASKDSLISEASLSKESLEKLNASNSSLEESVDKTMRNTAYKDGSGATTSSVEVPDELLKRLCNVSLKTMMELYDKVSDNKEMKMSFKTLVAELCTNKSHKNKLSDIMTQSQLNLLHLLQNYQTENNTKSYEHNKCLCSPDKGERSKEVQQKKEKIPSANVLPKKETKISLSVTKEKVNKYSSLDKEIDSIPPVNVANAPNKQEKKDLQQNVSIDGISKVAISKSATCELEGSSEMRSEKNFTDIKLREKPKARKEKAEDAPATVDKRNALQKLRDSLTDKELFDKLLDTYEREENIVDSLSNDEEFFQSQLELVRSKESVESLLQGIEKVSKENTGGPEEHNPGKSKEMVSDESEEKLLAALSIDSLSSIPTYKSSKGSTAGGVSSKPAMPWRKSSKTKETKVSVLKSKVARLFRSDDVKEIVPPRTEYFKNSVDESFLTQLSESSTGQEQQALQIHKDISAGHLPSGEDNQKVKFSKGSGRFQEEKKLLDEGSETFIQETFPKSSHRKSSADTIDPNTVNPAEIGKCFLRGFRSDYVSLGGDTCLLISKQERERAMRRKSQEEAFIEFSERDTPLEYLLALGFSIDEASNAIKDEDVKNRLFAAITEARIWINQISTVQGTLLYLIAYKAKPRIMRYYLQLVEAIINRRIQNAVKLDAFLRVLEKVEDGDLTMISIVGSDKFDDQENEEKIVKKQLRQLFINVYKTAEYEANLKKKPLTKEAVILLRILAAKYRAGLHPHLELIARYIGQGLLNNEVQLEGAMIYLSRLDTADVNLKEFEQYCGIVCKEEN